MAIKIPCSVTSVQVVKMILRNNWATALLGWCQSCQKDQHGYSVLVYSQHNLNQNFSLPSKFSEVSGLRGHDSI